MCAQLVLLAAVLARSQRRCCCCGGGCWGEERQRQGLQVEDGEAWHISAGEQGTRGHGAEGELDGIHGCRRLVPAVWVLVVLLLVGVLLLLLLVGVLLLLLLLEGVMMLLLLLLLVRHGPRGLRCQLLRGAQHMAKQLAVCGLVGGCAVAALPPAAVFD